MKTLKYTIPNYEVISYIGKGANGEVFKVKDLKKDAIVALKTLSNQAEIFLALFKDEFNLLAHCKHLNIIEVYDFGFLPDRRAYFTMEFIDGMDILKFPENKSYAEFSPLLSQLLNGLGYIHSLGLIHCDLKPSNVLVTKDGKVKLTDFGLAFAGDKMYSEKIRGTLEYIAPEIIRGAHIDSRVDLYSLGVLLYEIATGYLPFEREKPIDLLKDHLFTIPETPQIKRLIFPKKFGEIILRLLRKDPNERFQNVEEIITTLGYEKSKLKKAKIIEIYNLRAATFINREPETKAWGKLYKDQRGCWIISGPRGLGKTRLLNEMKLYIQLQGGICIKSEKEPKPHIPFFTLSDILYPLIGQAKLYHKDLLKKYAPTITTILSGTHTKGHPSTCESIANKNVLLKSLYEFIKEAISAVPFRITLLLDDLDKIDTETSDFLLYLFRYIKEVDLQFIMAIEDMSYLPSEIFASQFVYHLPLKPLSPKATTEFINSILNINIKRFPSLFKKIWDSSQGNPLLIEETLNEALRIGVIYRGAAVWQIAIENVEKIAPTQRLKDIYQKYLSFINEEDLKILQAGSVIGDEFNISYLSHILEDRPIDLLLKISLLKEKGLLKETYKDNIKELHFSQPVIRNLIYKNLPDHTRVSFHQKVGEILEETSEKKMESLYQLAFHFSRANILDKAIKYSLEAADKAEETFSYTKAIEFLTPVIAQIEHISEEKNKNKLTGLLNKRGTDYIRVSKFKEAEQDFLKMHNLSREIGDKEKEILALLNLGLINTNYGNIKEALKYYQGALSISKEIKDQRHISKLLSNIGWCLISVGEIDKAKEYLDQSLQISQDIGYDVVSASNLHNIGYIYTLKSQDDEAIVKYREALELAERSKSYQLSAEICEAIGNIYSERDEYQNALKYYGEASEKFKKMEDLRSIAIITGNIALVHKKVYKYGRALNELQKALGLSREIGSAGFTAWCLGVTGELYQRIGNYFGAEENLLETINLAKKIGEKFHILSAFLILGENYRIMGEVEKAIKWHNQAKTMAQQLEFREKEAQASTSLALDYLEFNKIKEALVQAKKGLEIARGINRNETLADALFALANVYLATNNYNEFQRAYAQGIQISQKVKYLDKECAFYILRAKLPAEMNFKILKKALSLAEKIRNLEFLWEIHFLMGKYYETQKEDYQANKEYQKVIEIFKIILANLPTKLLQEKYLKKEIRQNALRHIAKSDRIISLVEVGNYLMERVKVSAQLDKERKLQTLVSLTGLMANIFSPDKLLDSLMDRIMEFTEAQRGFLVLFKNGGEITLKVTKNIDPETEEGVRLSKGIIEEVVRANKSIIIGSTISDKRFKSRPSVADLDLRAVMCVPLKKGKRVTGIIWADSDLLRKSFSTSDIEFLESLAALASVAIENAKLYESAVTDNISGLYNNRYFYQRLNEELERAKRYRHLLSLCIIDIDHFKDYNDTYGHLEGNKILWTISELIKKNLRTPDIACRYGGDEFVIILPGVNEKGAFNVVERIRKKVENLKIFVKNNMLTLSFGIASYPSNDIKNLNDFVEKADIALYQSKQAGGNKTTIYRPEVKGIKSIQPNLTMIEKWRIVELLNATTKIGALHAGNISELLEKILDTMLQLAEAKRGYILLADESGVLQVRVSRGLSSNLEQLTKEIGFSRSVVKETVEKKMPILIADALTDRRFKDKESIRAMELRSIICVPLLMNEKVKGVLYVDNKDRPGIFDQEDITLLSAFANFVSYTIENTSYLEDLLKNHVRLQNELRAKHKFENIIGVSSSMNDILEMVAKVSNTDVSVLIQGETGTGKELIANALHYNSSRALKPFICVNCAAIPETLLESELFGHEKGAFTGAVSSKPGKFEITNNGTIFFDEISELPLSLQPKLLRVLQSGEFERLGSTMVQHTDVRIIAATNKNLESLVNENKFRNDLYYRIAVVKIDISPLRERKDDIPVLIKYYLKKLCKEMGREELKIEARTFMSLVHYHFPGNVRELENILQYAVVVAQGKTITLNDLPGEVQISIQENQRRTPPMKDLKQLRKDLLKEERDKIATLTKNVLIGYLRNAEGNISRAAKESGMHRVSFHRLLKKYNIDHKEFKKSQ